MAKIIHLASQLTDADWELILSALKDTRYEGITEKCREAENRPQNADFILPKDIVNQGHEHVNLVLRKKKVPFRLTRIGQQGKEKPRAERLLAFVLWPVDY